MFDKAYAEFWQEFGNSRFMVLSTSYHDLVTSRMMSVIHLNGALYFQTDTALRKYNQLMNNPHVALCADNMQVEGLCRELGAPLENAAFCAAYQACFPGSFSSYSALNNERLFVVTPTFVERWVYQDGVPYIQTMDIPNRRYAAKKYLAN